MIIRGARPQSGWYALDRRISEDERLSWAARGLLVYLLGKPDHWRVNVAHLRKQTEGARLRTGRDGVYALLAELQAAGYITTARSRGDDGRLDSVDYTVCESPRPAEPEVAPRPAQPYTAQPTLDKTEGAVIPDKDQKPSARQVALRSRFAEFWLAYPVKKGKAKAQARWAAMKLDDVADLIIGHVRLMLEKDDQWKRGFIPHGSTYIAGRRWEDEPVGAADGVCGQTGNGGKMMSGLQALDDLARGARG